MQAILAHIPRPTRFHKIPFAYRVVLESSEAVCKTVSISSVTVRFLVTKDAHMR